MKNAPKSTDTHQTRCPECSGGIDRIYCRAVRVEETTDYPGIVVDRTGFEPAKIRTSNYCDERWQTVPRGGFIIERDGRPSGVLSEDKFAELWEPIETKITLGPALKNLLERLRTLVAGCERGGIRPMEDVELWVDGGEYGHLTLGEIREAVEECP